MTSDESVSEWRYIILQWPLPLPSSYAAETKACLTFVIKLEVLTVCQLEFVGNLFCEFLGL